MKCGLLRSMISVICQSVSLNFGPSGFYLSHFKNFLCYVNFFAVQTRKIKEHCIRRKLLFPYGFDAAFVKLLLSHHILKYAVGSNRGDAVVVWQKMTAQDQRASMYVEDYWLDVVTRWNGTQSMEVEEKQKDLVERRRGTALHF